VSVFTTIHLFPSKQRPAAVVTATLRQEIFNGSVASGTRIRGLTFSRTIKSGEPAEFGELKIEIRRSKKPRGGGGGGER
jgi:hypothetical protein